MVILFQFGGKGQTDRIHCRRKKKDTRKLTPIWGSLEMVQKGEGKFPCLNISWVVLEFYA